MKPATLYEQLVSAGVATDSHASDLYCEVTPTSSKIVTAYLGPDGNVTRFRSQIDGRPWFEIPFAYDPFWVKRAT